MSAYRQAMLSVAPERVEQFSLELKQSIGSKKTKRKSSDQHKHRRTDSKKSKKSKKEKSSKDLSKSKDSSKNVSKKRKKAKDYPGSKKQKSSKSNNDSLTDDSDLEENGLDLNNELFPLSHYVKDRQKLFEVMFHIVKGQKLVAMLPDILKNMTEEEIKKKCFSHLEVMSSKRINHVLAGEAMQSSSGTDSEPETKNSFVQHTNEALAKIPVQASILPFNDNETSSLQTNFVDSTTSSGCEVLSLLAAGSMQEHGSAEVTTSDQNVLKRGADNLANEDGEVVSDEEVVLEENEVEIAAPSEDESSNHSSVASNKDEVELETVEIVEDVEYEDMVDAMLEETLPLADSEKESDSAEKQTTNNDSTNTAGLSQLELLELQLRARAIKSLMKAAQDTSNPDT